MHHAGACSQRSFKGRTDARAETLQSCDRAAVLRAGELVGVYDLAAERRLAARQATAAFDQEPSLDAFLSLPADIRVLSRDGQRGH